MIPIFADTGTVSFLLYGILILITASAMFVAYRHVLASRIPLPRLEKLIELFKYAIVTTAISTVTLIMGDLFKEREQDIRELRYFDSYAADIKQADNILVRVQLSKYFSTVAPHGEMKRSWKAYYDSVQIEYREYLKAKRRYSPEIEKSLRIDAAENSLTAPSTALLPAGRFVVNPSPDAGMASEQEQRGFEALTLGKFAEAADAFTRSENAKNGYHSSYELARLLRSSGAAMEQDPGLRRELLGVIAEKYAASASASTREWLEAQTK